MKNISITLTVSLVNINLQLHKNCQHSTNKMVLNFFLPLLPCTCALYLQKLCCIAFSRQLHNVLADFHSLISENLYSHQIHIFSSNMTWTIPLSHSTLLTFSFTLRNQRNDHIKQNTYHISSSRDHAAFSALS